MSETTTTLTTDPRPGRAPQGWMVWLFFITAILCTFVLVLVGKAELWHFFGVLSWSGTCLGFYYALPPGRGLPGVGPGGPPASVGMGGS